MSEDTAGIDHMDYAGLTQNALRSVIRQALLRAAMPEGLPGEHHFYVTFLTHAEGVDLPADVKARYPKDITIVLQHQYRDLKVHDDYFNVTLSFGGIPKVLRIPYGAITRFYDPAVQFVLEFEIDETGEFEDGTEVEEIEAEITELPKKSTQRPGKAKSEAEATSEDAPNGDDDRPKVVSLEQFRKK